RYARTEHGPSQAEQLLAVGVNEQGRVQQQASIRAVAHGPEPFGLASATKSQLGGVVEDEEALAPRLVAKVEVRPANGLEGDCGAGEELIDGLGVGPVLADARDAGG